MRSGTVVNINSLRNYPDIFTNGKMIEHISPQRMISILKITAADNSFSLEENWSSYIAPYVHSFLSQHIEKKATPGTVRIDHAGAGDFYNSIASALKHLLNTTYVEPSPKDIQRNASRFEKISLEGKVYRVNYRMSQSGRMAYALYCLLIFIGNADKEKLDILLEYA